MKTSKVKHKPKRGRPCKPKAEKRSRRLQITLTELELERLKALALADDLELVAWARRVLLKRR